MKRTCTFLLALLSLAAVLVCAPSARAQQQVSNLNASDLIPKTRFIISPASGTFTEGSVFQVPIYIDTESNSISAIELHVSYDPSILSIVKPSGGTSIIGLWIQNPSYDNSAGTASFVGGIPGGIIADYGLITTITFEAKAPGHASVRIDDASRALLSDGSGSPTQVESNQASYTIAPKAPGAVAVSSETHPFQDHWYNNNDPTFTWTADPSMTGFSYVLDNKPGTIPDDTVDGTDPIKAYQNVSDGISYFHLKALRHGIWSSTTDFEIRIDTEPPAAFTPTVNFLTAAVIDRGLVSFFTTDALSGIDHYEVGTIDKSKPASESPAFFRTESPYQIPFEALDNARVIVRAFDNAGNVRDESIDVTLPFLPTLFIKTHLTLILGALLALILGLIILHYLFGHRVMRHIRTIFRLAHNEKELEEIEKKEDHIDTPPDPGIRPQS